MTFSISISSFVDSADESTFSIYSDLTIGTQSAVLAVVFAVAGYTLAVSVSVGCAVGRTDSAGHTITVVVQNESTLADTLAESVVVAVVIAHNWSVLRNADIVSVFETSVTHALAINKNTVVRALVVGSGVTVAVTASDVGGNALTSLTSVPLILFAVVIIVIIIAIIWSGTIEEGNLVDELSWFEDLTVGLRLDTGAAVGCETDFASASVACPVSVDLSRTVALELRRLDLWLGWLHSRLRLDWSLRDVELVL